MGRYARVKGRNTKARPFVMIENRMQDSNAWRSLTPNARAVWLEIVRRHNGNNNGDIPLSCREAAELCNISANTAGRAFKQLQEHGFIKIAQYSDFRLKLKKATRWSLTHVHMDGQPPTQEWMKWKPEKIKHGVKTKGHGVTPDTKNSDDKDMKTIQCHVGYHSGNNAPFTVS